MEEDSEEEAGVNDPCGAGNFPLGGGNPPSGGGVAACGGGVGQSPRVRGVAACGGVGQSPRVRGVAACGDVGKSPRATGMATCGDTEDIVAEEGDSDSDQSLMTVSSAPDSAGKYWNDQGRKRSHPKGGTFSDSDSSSESAVSQTSATPSSKSKRGRGRPPTTGHYVGLAKAKQALVVVERLQMEAEVEKEVSAMARTMRTRRTSRMSDPAVSADESRLASSLHQQVQDSADIVLKIATKSRNLKGTCQKELKAAVAAIKEAAGILLERSATEETAQLQRENARLQAEVAELRKEMAELRAEVLQSRRRESLPPPSTQTEVANELPPVDLPEPACPPSRTTPKMEDVVRTIMDQVGTMLNARLEGLQDRLLPEKRIRPPLATDKAKNTATSELPFAITAPIAIGKQPDLTVEAPSAKATQKPREGKKSRKKRTSKAAFEAAAATMQARQGSNASHQTAEAQQAAGGTKSQTWATVVKRGAKPKGSGGSTDPGRTPQQKPQKPKKVKLRPPTSSAVVLTLQPGAAERGVTYAKVLDEARRKIVLADLGITSLGFRQAATGARMLEVPGTTSGEKADALAQRLQEFLNKEDVRVSRPMKCAEVRVSGLDDSTTAEDVLAAVARVGGCPVGSLKSGEIRRDVSGLGTVWVQCPVAAAKQVAESGRLLVGWVSARVKTMEPKQLRCYRCLESGHVAAKCSTETDRSKLCFRCGIEGHKANQCSAAPHCVLCAAAQKPSDHRVGSKACSAPTHKGKKGSRAGTGKPRAEQRQSKNSASVEDMEVTPSTSQQ